MNENERVLTARRALHDDHLRHLLNTFRNKLPELEVKQREHSRDADMRFTARIPDGYVHQDSENPLTIGISRVATTGLLGSGEPILEFFSFYYHRSSTDPMTDHPRDYLYNSCLFIFRKPSWYKRLLGATRESGWSLIPYHRTWWQRLIQGINELLTQKYSSLQYFPQHKDTDITRDIDTLHIGVTFDTIRRLGLQHRVETFLGVEL